MTQQLIRSTQIDGGSGGSLTLTGDITGSGTSPITTTLASSGAAAGTYGDGSNIPVVTVDVKGRVTSISTTPAAGGGGGLSQAQVLARVSLRV